jgi:hypothetical protein
MSIERDVFKHCKVLETGGNPETLHINVELDHVTSCWHEYPPI